MDWRNERNLLISRHSPLAYIRNRIPRISLSPFSFSRQTFCPCTDLFYLSPLFLPSFLHASQAPLPSPVSRELLSRSEELFMLPSNDLLSASFLRPFFSASLSAHPHHHPPPPPFISSLIHLKTTRTKLEGWLGFAEEFLVICSHIYGHCFPLVSSHSLQIQSALSMKIEWTRR